MKNGQKYIKEIQKMLNEHCYECALLNVRKNFDKPASCMISDSAKYGSKEFKEMCDKCLSESLEWLNEEYQEPILDDDEKDIIKEMLDVILKFGCEIDYIIKNDDGNGKAYILLSYSNKLTGYSDGITTPWFKNDKFKGMEIGKEYKLEDLGLENVED